MTTKERNAYSSEWSRTHRDSRRETERKYAARNRGKVTAKWWRQQLREYGITPEIYESMLVAQKGCCAICKGVNSNGRRLSVDHDHSTNKVRALLCGLCNTGLGAFRDNDSLLRQAAHYLKDYKV